MSKVEITVIPLAGEGRRFSVTRTLDHLVAGIVLQSCEEVVSMVDAACVALGVDSPSEKLKLSNEMIASYDQELARRHEENEELRKQNALLVERLARLDQS